MSEEVVKIKQKKPLLPVGIVQGNVAGNPRFMVLYGEPKTGKSTICSKLDGALIIDLAEEYEFLDAMKVQVGSFEELKAVMEEIIISKRHFPYIVIDNATVLYEYVKPYALKMYKSTAAGKHYNGALEDIPFGGNYHWPKMAFMMCIQALKKLTETLILVGHVRDESGENERALTKTSIDLVGQLRNEVLGTADTIALLYRRGNENVLDFAGKSNYIAQSRLPRLRGKEIVVAVSDERGNIKCNWDEIFTKKRELI
jgi:hypothetical protein